MYREQRSVEGADVVILGGTGSLGRTLCRRLLRGDAGLPASVTVMSRDEGKHHQMRLEYLHLDAGTEDVAYLQGRGRLRFEIGDVQSFADVRRAVDRADVLFHAAALKQVPTCEYFGAAAVEINVHGTVNLTRAVRETRREVAVVGISTDKACKPVNVMGMTKALQERLLMQANLDSPWARLLSVRCGNVLASRGSAIPFFLDRVRRGLPIPITDPRMTRFLMTLDQAVDLALRALGHAGRGETYLARVPAARVVDVAYAVAEDAAYPLEITGIRPGEKVHEILASEEEAGYAVLRGEDLVVLPLLPELRAARAGDEPFPLPGEYTSAHPTLEPGDVAALLTANRLTRSTASGREERGC